MFSWIIAAAIALAALAIAFYLWLNRNPIRIIPPENNLVSPADGKVTDIIDLLDISRKSKKIGLKKVLLGKIREIASGICDHGYVVLISASPLDVHVQRAPVEGKVVSVKHTKGKFVKAKSIEAALENEKNEIVVENSEIGMIKIIQVAGFLAKKIDCFVKKSEMLLKGQKIGRVSFGSHVILIIPDLYLKVKKGDHVFAGETVIAEYGENEK